MIGGPICGKALSDVNEGGVNVSMVGGPTCAVMPPNASKVERIRTSNKKVTIPFS
jgi:F420-0:gamma-glutamyl ligase-like protein